MTHRKYVSKGINDLESIYTEHISNRQVLEDLLHELGYRTRQRAIKLASKVRTTLENFSESADDEEQDSSQSSSWEYSTGDQILTEIEMIKLPKP